VDSKTLVRQQYSLDAASTEYLAGGGGFSGGELWRLSFPDDQRLCLRRWAKAHPTQNRLQFIHQAVAHAATDSRIPLAVPLRTNSGRSYFEHSGSFWELTAWLPGVADFSADPNSERLQQAMHAIARFHLATQSLKPQTGIPAGASSRLKLVKEMRATDADAIHYRLSNLDSPLQMRAARVLAHFRARADEVERQLQAAQLSFQLQPCLRDLWHDHLLFVGNQLTGIVDYGALNYESVAADLGRLLGSILGDDSSRWTEALEMYSTIRPLSQPEIQLAKLYDQANIVLSPMNWLRWIILEQRQFDDWAAVIQRLDSWISRMP
jgi:hypothetical protein